MSATTMLNQQFRLAARPVGLPKPTDWQQTSEPVREIGDGEIVVKALYLSLDPAMRGWMNEGKSYIAPVGIGEVMRGGGIGKVVASKSPAFAPHQSGLRRCVVLTPGSRATSPRRVVRNGPTEPSVAPQLVVSHSVR